MNFGAFNSSKLNNNGSLQWYECSSVFYVFVVSEILNTFLGLLTNIWMQVLILRDWRNQAMQEIFTINLGMLEILCCFLSQILLLNYLVFKVAFINKYSLLVYVLNFFGRALFQCGISVERYVAVVHPIFFFRHNFLKCKVIFLTLGWIFVVYFDWFMFIRQDLNLAIGFFIFLVSVNSFCSISILMILRQPSPGSGGAKKMEEMNLKKKRAAHTVMIIHATVILNNIPRFIVPTLTNYVTAYTQICVFGPLAFSCSLMGSFVQPLFFLHRAGKLQLHKESSHK